MLAVAVPAHAQEDGLVDGDGVPDTEDNCPTLANADQADCDADGKGDVCELAACSGSPWCTDCNGNGIPDGCDDALIRRNATFPIEHTVDGDFLGAQSVFAADVDGDGDTDVLGAADLPSNEIAWWGNTAGDGSAWTRRTVDGELDRPASVFAADVDGDGDSDVLGTAFNANDILWWENTAGDPLTTIDAGARIESLSVYLDDGAGDFDIGTDTLVTTVEAPALVDGVQTIDFADGDPLVQVAFGAPATFFVVVELVAAPAPPTELFHITHVAGSGEADDSVVDCSLTQEFPAANVTRPSRCPTATTWATSATNASTPPTPTKRTPTRTAWATHASPWRKFRCLRPAVRS